MNGLLASFSASVLFQWNTVTFFTMHIIIWLLCDYILLAVIQVCKNIGAFIFQPSDINFYIYYNYLVLHKYIFILFAEQFVSDVPYNILGCVVIPRDHVFLRGYEST